MDEYVFYYEPEDYSGRTLYVPAGTLSTYMADYNWSHYFGNIVEMNSDPDIDNGDMNGDGTINVSDITMLIGLIMNNSDLDVTQYPIADMNEDGTINISDLTILIGNVMNNH